MFAHDRLHIYIYKNWSNIMSPFFDFFPVMIISLTLILQEYDRNLILIRSTKGAETSTKTMTCQ